MAHAAGDEATGEELPARVRALEQKVARLEELLERLTRVVAAQALSDAAPRRRRPRKG
ncbi:MAG: hypothetical protein ACK4N5_16745 [Myxococcales bacterium]